MVRVNPPVHAEGYVYTPTGRVTGLLDDEAELEAVLAAFRGVGVPDDDVEVFLGEQGAEALDLTGKAHGLVPTVARKLAHVLGEEAPIHDRVDAALHRGAALVVVPPSDDDQRFDLYRILQDHGATEVHYWARWTVRDPPPPESSG